VRLVLMFHYWLSFRSLRFTHSAGRRSCQSHYSIREALLYIITEPSNIPSHTSHELTLVAECVDAVHGGDGHPQLQLK